MPIKSTEEIKAELLEHYKNQQPVLLYGKDNVGRLDLVLEVHEGNGGVIYPVEYIKSEKEPDSKIFINEIGKQLKIALHGERNKKTTLITGAKRVGNPSLRKKPMNIQMIAEIENKVQLRFKSTDKNFREIDCEPYNGGEAVYDYLTQNTLLANIPIFNNPSLHVPINESFLFGFKGVLFLNNLYKYKNTNNKRDLNCYRLLGGIIKERKLVSPITKEQFNVAFRWLVIYADVDDPKKIFPSKFRKQFVEIRLDDDGIKQEGGEGEVKTKEATPFPTPQDAKWSDVEITFVDSEYVNIKVKDNIKSGVHYSQMGFKHATAPKEIKLWKTLRLFAIANGIIIPKFGTKGELIKTVSGDDVKRLRLKLKSYFGISGTPIPPYDKGKYINKKEGGKEHIEGEGYKTIFVIKDETSIIKQKDEFIDTADNDPDY